MTEPFIGEIQVFGFSFNPRGWAFCNGALIPIQQNTALFSLLGTNYGGDGKTTFQLPNFASRGGCEQGQGPGLTPRVIGETFGDFTVSLTSDQVPAHSHGFNLYAQTDSAKRSASPAPGAALSVPTVSTTTPFYPPGVADTSFSPAMLAPSAGGNLPHANQQPYLALNFCIALQGTFPSFP